jgi:RNA polymerase sigma factor (TIGR02999 family)
MEATTLLFRPRLRYKRNMDQPDQSSAESPTDLFRLVYDELRRLAAAQLARVTQGGTLTATVLVHEAFIRLSQGRASWEDRRHFLNAAAQAMRHILISHARRKNTLKRGKALHRLELDELDVAVLPPDDELIALDEALNALAACNPRGAEVVRMRYFAGAGWADIALALNQTEDKVRTEWAFARAWLFARLNGSEPGGQGGPPGRPAAPSGGQPT